MNSDAAPDLSSRSYKTLRFLGSRTGSNPILGPYAAETARLRKGGFVSDGSIALTQKGKDALATRIKHLRPPAAK